MWNKMAWTQALLNYLPRWGQLNKETGDCWMGADTEVGRAGESIDLAKTGNGMSSERCSSLISLPWKSKNTLDLIIYLMKSSVFARFSCWQRLPYIVPLNFVGKAVKFLTKIARTWSKKWKHSISALPYQSPEKYIVSSLLYMVPGFLWLLLLIYIGLNKACCHLSIKYHPSSNSK